MTRSKACGPATAATCSSGEARTYVGFMTAQRPLQKKKLQSTKHFNPFGCQRVPIFTPRLHENRIKSQSDSISDRMKHRFTIDAGSMLASEIDQKPPQNATPKAFRSQKAPESRQDLQNLPTPLRSTKRDIFSREKLARKSVHHPRSPPSLAPEHARHPPRLRRVQLAPRRCTHPSSGSHFTSCPVVGGQYCPSFRSS